MEYTDEDLTRLYNEANGIASGKRPPITTERIFAAMRHIAGAQHEDVQRLQPEQVQA